MSNLILVRWQDQIDWMTANACASGSTSYDEVRSEMWDGLYDQHGHAEFEVEEIPEDEFNQFINWLEMTED